MRYTAAVLLAAALLSGQSFPVGTETPAMPGRSLDPARPFPGWSALRGSIVVIDFWATWCGPCLPALDKIARLEKEFAGQPIRFFTVASDEHSRVKQYFAEKGLALHTFVEPADGKGIAAWGASTLPAAALVGRDGRVLAITPGENVTTAVLHKALRGEPLDLPPFLRDNNIYWDREEVQWQDGIQPIFQVIIKRIDVSGGGIAHPPGGNWLSGDGANLSNMIQTAWQTDHLHLDRRIEWPRQTYRFAARVPKGREAELLPALQDALARTFGIRLRWEEQLREVLILTHDTSAKLRQSDASEAAFTFQRGKITARKQTAASLAAKLPNWMHQIVVDETGLTGDYDFNLEYRDDGPAVLTASLRKYGLLLTPGKRKVTMLVVEPKN